MEIKNKLNRAGLPDARETYETPIIEIVEVRVEQGFQGSLRNDPEDEASF